MEAKTKVLICGVSGFIGKNLLERYLLKDDVELYGTYNDSVLDDIPGVKLIKADLTDPQDVKKVVSGMDVIIQAAATTSGAKDIVNKPYYHVTDNAVMNSLLFRAAFEEKVKHVVFFSCTVMYGSGETPVKETDFDANAELHPNYFGVGWTKVYIEKMCEFYSRIGGTRYTAIRHSNIYGPHDKFDLERSHVFGATMTKVLTAEEDKIVVWGEGAAKRDLLYVSDLVDFVELALEKQKSDYALYNVGLGECVSVKDLVEKIIDASGRALEIEYDLDKPNIKTTLCLDIGKAASELGWKPAVSLEEGIQKTMAWWKEKFASQ